MFGKCVSTDVSKGSSEEDSALSGGDLSLCLNGHEGRFEAVKAEPEDCGRSVLRGVVPFPCEVGSGTGFVTDICMSSSELAGAERSAVSPSLVPV